jgi:excisionase family DNA binding protein
MINDTITSILSDQFTATPAEVQRILRCGRKAVYRAIAAKEIPSLSVGRNIRIPTAFLRTKLGMDVAA